MQLISKVIYLFVDQCYSWSFLQPESALLSKMSETKCIECKNIMNLNPASLWQLLSQTSRISSVLRGYSSDIHPVRSPPSVKGMMMINLKSMAVI